MVIPKVVIPEIVAPETAIPEMIIMGRIIGAQGILGWVKIKTYTEFAENLTDYKTWWLGSDDGKWQKVGVEKFAVQSKGLIAKFPGCEDRTAAEAYRSLLIAIPRNLLPPQPEDEFYWSDLIGLAVENVAGEQLGIVESLMDTGANQVLCVRMANKKELLIPFIASAIKQVSLADKKICVDWAVDWASKH